MFYHIYCMFASDYTFYQSDRIGSDASDQSQQNVQSSAYMSSVMSHYAPDKMSSAHVDFAIKQPGMMVSGTNGGYGLGASAVDAESNLLWKSDPQRPLEKLQLFPRTFLSVPYLGRGSCDPTLESQLMQGENVRGKKSVSTVMEQSFNPIDQYPMNAEKRSNAGQSIEELALKGWVRGGQATREMEENDFSKKSKPSNLL